LSLRIWRLPGRSGNAVKNNDQRSSLFWLAIGLAVAFYSRNYDLGTPSSPGPGFLPFLSGAAIAVLALVVFFQQIPKKRDTLKSLWAHKKWPAVPIVMASLVVYAVVLNYLGFILDTFLLTAFLLRVMEPLRWNKVLAGATGATAGSYAVFHLWLEAQLPAGLLGF
jgi:putative tricarboxylic transport membrane protein